MKAYAPAVYCMCNVYKDKQTNINSPTCLLFSLKQRSQVQNLFHMGHNYDIFHVTGPGPSPFFLAWGWVCGFNLNSTTVMGTMTLTQFRPGIGYGPLLVLQVQGTTGNLLHTVPDLTQPICILD